MQVLNKTIIAICLLMLNAPFTSAIAAKQDDLKIGFVNVKQVLANAPQVAIAEKAVQTEFTARREELKGLQSEILALREKLTREGLTMSNEDRAQYEEDLLRKDREFRWEQGIFDEDLKIRRNQVLQQLQQDVAKAILQIAQSDKYDLILTEGVIFGSDRVNITEQVVKILEKDAAK